MKAQGTKEIITKRFVQIALLLILISKSGMAQPFSEDTAFLKNGKSQPDSNQANKGPRKSWKLFQMQTGLAYGSRSNAGYGQPGPGLILPTEIGTFAFGFERLHGAGLGFSVFEFMLSSSLGPDKKTGNWSSDGTPTSLFPVYLYYPIFSKERKIKKWQVHSPFGYLFAGGSGWGWPNNYLHIGVNTILVTWDVSRQRDPLDPFVRPARDIFDAIATAIVRAYPTMNLGVQAGFFYSGRYNERIESPFTGRFGEPPTLDLTVDKNYGFYVSLRIGFGAAFIK
jgi:hypothetical protein